MKNLSDRAAAKITFMDPIRFIVGWIAIGIVGLVFLVILDARGLSSALFSAIASFTHFLMLLWPCSAYRVTVLSGTGTTHSGAADVLVVVGLIALLSLYGFAVFKVETDALVVLVLLYFGSIFAVNLFYASAVDKISRAYLDEPYGWLGSFVLLFFLPLSLILLVGRMRDLRNAGAFS